MDLPAQIFGKIQVRTSGGQAQFPGLDLIDFEGERGHEYYGITDGCNVKNGMAKLWNLCLAEIQAVF